MLFLRKTGSASILLLLSFLASRASAQDCSGTSTGKIPVNDLGTGTYQGAQGGLYPGGSNVRPAPHNTIGMNIALQEIKPRDSSGTIDLTAGKIGMASLGMSVTSQEFTRLIEITSGDPDLNPRLVLVNGASSGMNATHWAKPNDEAWSTFANRLKQANLAAAQLQVVWVKLAFSEPGKSGLSFPERTAYLQDLIKKSILNLKQKYPNVRIVYLSSRIYAGYAPDSETLNPEPYAYETAFSVKGLIEEQIGGSPDLSLEKAPWMGWGTYLWADGVGADNVAGGIPGRSDGLEYVCSDFISDGTHPSTSGRTKVAQMLLTYLKTDWTARPWFLADPGEPPPDPVPAPSPEGSGSGGGGGGGCGCTGLELLISFLFLRRWRRSGA